MERLESSSTERFLPRSGCLSGRSESQKRELLLLALLPVSSCYYPLRRPARPAVELQQLLRIDSSTLDFPTPFPRPAGSIPPPPPTPPPLLPHRPPSRIRLDQSLYHHPNSPPRPPLSTSRRGRGQRSSFELSFTRLIPLRGSRLKRSQLRCMHSSWRDD
jgi:hypothetical protein